MKWSVEFSTKAKKQVRILNQKVVTALNFLVEDLKTYGPIPSNGWPNYSKLKDQEKDLRHCHLIKGKPTYVCCWEVINKKVKIILRCIMLAHMKKLLIKGKNKNIVYVAFSGKTYAIPEKVMKLYLVTSSENQTKEETVSSDEVFEDLHKKFSKAGALLKGVRARENLNQAEFSRLIEVTQANLSKMETGKRSIGKQIAKRIEGKFGVNYKYFLE